MDQIYYKIAERYFCVQDDGEDLEWFASIWSKLKWGGTTEIRKEKIKIYIITLANIYYEFIHEAYGITYELFIDEDAEFFIKEFKISPIRIRELLEEKKIQIDDDYNLVKGIIDLVKWYKHEVFEELIYVYERIEDVYYGLAKINPDAKAEHEAWEYVMHWGDTYSSFW